MLTTDFTYQEGRGQLQKVRRLLARAVTESKGDTEKNAWLDAMLDSVAVDVAADVPWSRGSTDSDANSYNTVPGLIPAITKATAESSIYGGDYKTQWASDVADAIAELAA